MDFIIKDTKYFSAESLQALFLSVGWSSGQYPEKLTIAMKHSGAVFSAWDKERLIGLINAMDDGIMNAYIQYLLVDPIYQKRGIGRELIKRILSHYQSYLRTTLIAYNNALDFYRSCGFCAGENTTPMSVTSLTT